MVPAISIILVLITVVYTTMGGLKAVVMTDVLQTAVMFVGVILAIVVIGWKVGSVDAFFESGSVCSLGVRRFFYRCNEKNDCREYLYYDIGLAGFVRQGRIRWRFNGIWQLRTPVRQATHIKYHWQPRVVSSYYWL